jgi:hypothetical protein
MSNNRNDRFVKSLYDNDPELRSIVDDFTGANKPNDFSGYSKNELKSEIDYLSNILGKK